MRSPCKNGGEKNESTIEEDNSAGGTREGEKISTHNLKEAEGGGFTASDRVEI